MKTTLMGLNRSNRNQKSSEDQPPSAGELTQSDASPGPRPAAKRRIVSSPDSIDEGEVEANPDNDDIGDIFQPQLEDGYDNGDANDPIPPPQPSLPPRLCLRRQHLPPQPNSQTKPLDATTLISIETLREVRIATNTWVSDVAPLDDWPQVFQEHYDAACERITNRTTQEEVDEFLQRVERHAEIGRSILRKLRGSPIVSPPPSHEAWGDFLAAGDLMETLYRGIAILEVRLDIFAPRGPLASPADSGIRRWKGLVDKF
jgi:hypothetical protein